MKMNFDLAFDLALECLISGVGAASLLVVGCVSAEPKQMRGEADIYSYGHRSPNRSYQAGPHTRIYVTNRSWLDGSTEVQPGERKFSDYAFPPGYSFARENNNRPVDRQPLNPPMDAGGYSMQLPLY